MDGCRFFAKSKFHALSDRIVFHFAESAKTTTDIDG